MLIAFSISGFKGDLKKDNEDYKIINVSYKMSSYDKERKIGNKEMEEMYNK